MGKCSGALMDTQAALYYGNSSAYLDGLTPRIDLV